MSARYVIGIDLGTTNSVLAYAPLDDPQAPVQVLEVPQLVAAGQVEARQTLPSFTYLASAEEARAGQYDLPWQQGADYAVGQLARQQAAMQPQRTVAAAKSWLCYSRIDRREPILPWATQGELERISPVEASRRYLAHLIAAWDEAFPDSPLSRQRVVLTVPASFDASGRELTRESAQQAGLPEDAILLEEPQAALYAWLADVGDNWRRRLKVGHTLLVCDVGGGTTDLTLIRVDEEDGELALRRVAVGRHTLVGGDNMDLALAHAAGELFKEKGHEMDVWQSVSLWHACRLAKEALLSSEDVESHPVTVLGRGSRLVGGTVSIDLSRSMAQSVILDGFFPHCEADAKPLRQRRSGFREIGLPYESDARISVHLAAFLAQHGGDEAAEEAPGAAGGRATHVLFNGGVFKAEALRQRVLEVMTGWYGPDAAPRALGSSDDLDFAVARGAAHYARTREHGGVRIRGGTARSYYVGIETAGLAVPGAPRPLKALCVVPFGMEEGTEVAVPSEPFGLVVGEPAHFRFFSSAVRKQDRPGDLLPRWGEDELEETDPLEATLEAEEAGGEEFVPVTFQSRITELGVFELWCVSTESDRRWKLEFSVREDAEEVAAP